MSDKKTVGEFMRELLAERDALKRRVEELEKQVISLQDDLASLQENYEFVQDALYEQEKH
jgi:chaperonin cofactor prefoldin